MDRKNNKDNSKELQLYTHSVCGNDLTFQKVCFHVSHDETQWTNQKNEELWWCNMNCLANLNFFDEIITTNKKEVSNQFLLVEAWECFEKLC